MTARIDDTRLLKVITDAGLDPEVDEQVAAGLSDEEYLADSAAVDQRPGNA